LPDFRVILDEYVRILNPTTGVLSSCVVVSFKYETPGTVYRTSAVVR